MVFYHYQYKRIPQIKQNLIKANKTMNNTVGILKTDTHKHTCTHTHKHTHIYGA